MEKKYRELARLFLKLGFFAYGGPAAHIAMMSDEVVQKKKWFNDKEFVDLLSFTNLIPGPNSTEMAILIGYKQGGVPGLLIAGLCFILPAVLIVLALSAFYLAFQGVPQIQSVFQGLVPAVFVIILAAVFQLSRKNLDSVTMAVVFTLCLLLHFRGISELLVMLFGAVSILLGEWVKEKRTRLLAVEPFSLGLLFLTFLKIGSVLYGSGYVLISFIQTEFVDRLQWLTAQQVIDMVAIGEITPGPVFTTATAVGYLLGGIPGGMVATAGIFIPSFLLIGFIFPLYERIRKWEWTRHVLKGLNAASLAIMASVAFRLGAESVTDWAFVLFAAAALFLLLRYKVNNVYLLLAGALLGFLLY